MSKPGSSQLQLHGGGEPAGNAAEAAVSSQLLASGSWMAPGELFKMFRRLKHSRRNNKACKNCKDKKVGCDGSNPCARCVKKGLQCGDIDVPASRPAKRTKVEERGETIRHESGNLDLAIASDWTDLQASPTDHDLFWHSGIQSVEFAKTVERPLPSPHRWNFNDPGGPFSSEIRRELPSSSFRMAWLFGKHKESILGLFRGLPTALIPVTKAAMAAVQVLQDLEEDPSPPGPSTLTGSSPVSISDTESVGRTTSCDSTEGYDLEIIQDQSPSAHTFTMEMDMANLRRLAFSVGHLCASFSGIHPEETCARIGNHEFKYPTTQVESFCSTMDNLLNGQDASKVRYCRWKRRYMSSSHKDSDGYQLVRTENRIAQKQGIISFQQRIDLISPEEYEEALKQNPYICRPLTHLLQDNRRGVELLEHAPELETWDGLLSTDEGRRRVQALAEELERRFSAVVSAAEQKTETPIRRLEEPFAVIDFSPVRHQPLPVPSPPRPTFALGFR